MAKVLVVSEQEDAYDLQKWLKTRRVDFTSVDPDEVFDAIKTESVKLVILVLASYARANSLARIIKDETQLPVLMLIPDEQMNRIALPIESDDFAILSELRDDLYLRVMRLLPGKDQSPRDEQIDCGALVIDLASCEVSLNGEPLDLTFREYELLKFLASNRGRTFTRETLLDRVWGYDYIGGDRTVDVHIRRLRTKTDTADRPFIETVRNIGYRFRK